MPEQLPNNTSSGQGATPQTGSGAMPNTATPGAMPGTAPTMTLEEALARIADLERHSANKEEQATRHGTKLTEVEKELAAYKEKERKAQEATLSEQQKLAKRAEEVEQKYQQEHKAHVNALVKLAASSKGIIDPDIAALAIADQLEYDKDSGMPTNLDDALDKLIKAKPYLAKATEPAQTPSQTQQRPTPQFTANNPGRSGIVQPGQPLSPKDWPKLGSGQIFPNKG